MSRSLIQSPLLVVLAILPLAALSQEVAPVDALRAEVIQAQLQHTDLLIVRGLPMLFLLGIIVVVVLFATAREKRRNELLARFIDRGQEIPASLLPRAPSQAHSRQRALRTGTLLILGSLALGAALGAGFLSFKYIAWCLVPLSLGIGCFINAAFFYRDPGAGR